MASPSKRACPASRAMLDMHEAPAHVQHGGDLARMQPATASAGGAGGGAGAPGCGLRRQRSCYDLRLLDLQHQCRQQGLVPAADSSAYMCRYASCDKSTRPQAQPSWGVQQTALDLSHLSLSQHGPAAAAAAAAAAELARGGVCLHGARSAGGDADDGVDAAGSSASLSSAETRVHMAVGAGLSANSSASAMTGRSSDTSPSSSAVSPCASIASSSSSSFCTLN